jgi:hypothetical protein
VTRDAEEKSKKAKVEGGTVSLCHLPFPGMMRNNEKI